MTAFKHAQVVLNPAASAGRPVMEQLGAVFSAYGVTWNVSTTGRDGDGARIARAAIDQGADVVVACGGDGTVMDVANGLVHSDMPLAIVPTGTGNVLVAEFGIPRHIEKAARLIVDGSGVARQVDMGIMEERGFLLRAGSGLEAGALTRVTKQLKRRYGVFAYIIAGVQELMQTRRVRYYLTLDGETIETSGVGCMIANAGTTGYWNRTLNTAVSASDGLLDVFIVDKSLRSVLITMARVMTRREVGTAFQHWQAREVHIVSDPPQLVQADGDLWQDMTTPIRARIVPRALRIVMPGGVV